MRAITLRQPWAGQVFDKWSPKDVENRSRLTPPPDVVTRDPKGPPIKRPFLAIHAGNGYDKHPPYPAGVSIPGRDFCTFGAIIGVVQVFGHYDSRKGEAEQPNDRRVSASRWWLGPIGWDLLNAIPIEPLHMGGRLGCWHLLPTVEREVMRRALVSLRDIQRHPGRSINADYVMRATIGDVTLINQHLGNSTR